MLFVFHSICKFGSPKWPFHFDSEDDYRTGCRKVSHCQQHSFQDYTHDHMDYHIPYTYMKQLGFKTFQIICHVLVFMITRDRFTDTAAILN